MANQSNSQPEFQLQCSFIEWLEYQHPNVLFCATVGGVRQTLLQGLRLKKQGYRKGIPDLMIYEQNLTSIGLALEFKAGKNKPTEYQTRWHNDLRARQWQVHTVYTLEDAIKVTNDYLKLKNDLH